jgi:hypothetical protein
MVLLVTIAGCGSNKEPMPLSTDGTQLDINVVTAEENRYREGLAKPPITSGLSCTIATFTSGHRLQATSNGVQTLTGLVSAYTYLYRGEYGETFNQYDSLGADGNIVIPRVFRPLFINYYSLDCVGHVVVLRSDYYTFESQSDDASLVYLDDTILLDNDNNHGVQTVSKVKFLRRGVHSFRVRYEQSGGGNIALVVLANGELINPKFLYH